MCGDKEEVTGLTNNPKMICCDKCEAWQHNLCMNIPEDDDDLPEQYFCEQCKPANHKELLAAIARGEHPWEERLQQRREQEKLKKSKKSRKSKGGRNSAVGTESEPATTPKSVAVDTPTSQPTTSSRRKTSQLDTAVQAQVGTHASNGPELRANELSGKASPVAPQLPSTPTAYVEISRVQRRKSAHPGDENPLKRRQSAKMDESTMKRRKSSVAFDPPVDHIDMLPEDRKKTAQFLFKEIKTHVENSLKNGTWSLQGEDTADAKAANLARDIEYEVYARFSRPEEVTARNDQLRSIVFNFKKNPALLLDLLNEVLMAQELALMSSEQMASEELQRERAALKEEADKQAIIHHEEGPRVRKTHKGDELVVEEDEHSRSVPEPAFAPNVPTTPRAGEDYTVPHSPSGTPGSRTAAKVGVSSAKPLIVNTAVNKAFVAPNRKPSANFDINTVWSKVRSPEIQQIGFTPITPSIPAPLAVRGPGEDADIDRLLKDDEMEGVSPTSGTAGVWRGKLYMKKQPSALNVLGTAQFLGGADPSQEVPWGQLISGDIEINGRIATERADEYLTNFRWSSHKNLSILKFAPDPQPAAESGENGHNKSDFAHIFDYFVGHNRWGVSKSPEQPDALIDFYIIPVRAGAAPLPKCIEYMANVDLEAVRAEDAIYFVLVVQGQGTPTGDRPASAVPLAATPQSAVPPRDLLGHPPNPADTTNNQPQPPQLDSTSIAAVPAPDPNFNPPELAVEILGNFVHTPVARSVLQLPGISRQQLENLKHAFETDPMTREDLNYLSQFLRAEAGQPGREQNEGEALSASMGNPPVQAV